MVKNRQAIDADVGIVLGIFGEIEVAVGNREEPGPQRDLFGLAWLGKPLPSWRSYIPSIAATVALANLALLIRRVGAAYDFIAAARGDSYCEALRAVR